MIISTHLPGGECRYLPVSSNANHRPADIQCLATVWEIQEYEGSDAAGGLQKVPGEELKSSLGMSFRKLLLYPEFCRKSLSGENWIWRAMPEDDQKVIKPLSIPRGIGVWDRRDASSSACRGLTCLVGGDARF